MNTKRINILFQNRNYELEVNQFHSIHHVVNDLYNNIIKKELPFYKKFYYTYLIENKDYFLKVIQYDEVKNKDKDYLNPNYAIGLYNNYELCIYFDIIILLNIIMEYNTFIIKNVMITYMILQYVFLKICNDYFNIKIENISFIYFSNITIKILSISLILFTIMWIILLYIIFIKNKDKK